MPQPRSSAPLRDAVTKLLKNSRCTQEEIAQIAGVVKDVPTEWLRGTTLPPDRRTSMILRGFESMQDPVVLAALSQFWDEIRAIEKSESGIYELILGDEDARPSDYPYLLLQFTHRDWTDSLVSAIKRVHPSRRSACLTAMAELAKQFVGDD